MTGRKSLLEAYRERPYRNIFFALLVVILVDALAPNAFSRGRFSDLMRGTTLSGRWSSGCRRSLCV